MRLTRYFAAKVIAVVSLSVVSFAQQPPPQDQDDSFDPDSVNRGVARISVMNGDVSVQRGDSGEIVAAAINAPLVVGDRVLTGPNSRAEVQFDLANMIRIASDSEIRLAEIADHRYQIQLARGLATFRVLRASDAGRRGEHAASFDPAQERRRLSDSWFVTRMSRRSRCGRAGKSKSSRHAASKRCEPAGRCRFAGPPPIPNIRSSAPMARMSGTAGIEVGTRICSDPPAIVM